MPTTIALNEQQQLAVENLSDHLLLLAGAGTGKTNTLAHRVANLLVSGAAEPAEILCLTFTNRACKEMVERIAKIAGEPAEEVTVRTIHSFCAWLLRSMPQRLTDIGRDFAICDQADCQEAIREVVFEVVGRQIADHPVQILQRFIGLVKDCQLADPSLSSADAAAWLFSHRPEAVEQICVNPRRQPDPKFQRFLARYGGSIVRLYNRKLTASNLLDFSDLLLRADALLADPETAALWRDRYRYIHVDEVQDVSLAEYGLLSRLFGRANILFCGDFNQTIYQWRGSDPERLLARFRADCHPVEITFTHNYRSSGQLLSAAQNFLARAMGRGHPDGFEPQSPACTDLVFRQFDTIPEEVDWVYREIAQLPVDDYSRVAIITRSNKACADVCNLLKTSRLHAEKPIRFMLADEFRLFKTAEVKDLLACISLFANPQDAESLKRVAMRLVHGIGPATVEGIVSGYRDGMGVALTDFTDPRTHLHQDFFAPLLQALEAGRVVVFDVESTGTDVFQDEIIQMAGIRLAPDGSVAERFERFLRAGKPVGDSEKVHGFSDAWLAAHGEPPADALHAFLDFAEGCVIVGHNVGFDMAITARNLLRQGIQRPFDHPFYDTLDLSRRFLKDLDNHKLGTVSAALHTAHTPSHDAMDDILATADVLVALVGSHLRPQTLARQGFYLRYLSRFEPLAHQLDLLRPIAQQGASPLISALLDAFGFEKRYEQQPEKFANLVLFQDFAEELCDPAQPAAQQLSELLELTALSASELEKLSKKANKVSVITAHQAKGCEFDYVFLPILQDGVFPSFQAVKNGVLEEEKRVFYVSVTRAKQKLFLSCARYGLNQYKNAPSRFLEPLGFRIEP